MPGGSPIQIDLLIHELTPYRVHLIGRFARELPGARFRVLQSLEHGGLGWRNVLLPAGVEHELVGPGERVEHQGRWTGWVREWRKGRRIIDAVGRRGTDLLITTSYNDLGHLRAIRWCGRRGVPCFLWADSSIRSEQARGAGALVKRLVLPRVLRGFERVLPWGRWGREFFLKYGVPDERIQIVPAEPDYSVIENVTEADIEEARGRHGLPASRRYLLFVGRLAPEKRVDLLIDAFAGLADARPGWDLVIAGDGPLAEPLRRRVPERLSARIHWLGAVVEARALAAVYRACDVFVLPSDYEPWGIVVNEAAAAGLALVCSDVVGAAHELVIDGENGRTFPHGSVPALAEALGQVTGDGLALVSSQAASRRVLQGWRGGADPVRALARLLVPSTTAASSQAIYP